MTKENRQKAELIKLYHRLPDPWKGVYRKMANTIPW